MKDIKNYDAKKYSSNENVQTKYLKVADGIFETGAGKNKLFVTSISFVQEPALGEGKTADCISQYPLEDILDKYYCHVSDFYEELNDKKSKICYLELASDKKEHIEDLRGIIGKHVYNKEEEQGEKRLVRLVIE